MSYCLHDVDPEPNKMCVTVTNTATYRDRVRSVARVIQSILKKNYLPGDMMDTDAAGTAEVFSRKVRFRGRNSASQTVIIDGVFIVKCDGNPHLPIKVVFKWYRENDKDVLKEAQSYSCIINGFQLPFFAFPLSVALPGLRMDNMPMQHDVKLRFRAKDTEQLGFIMSENCGTMTLGQYVGDTASFRPFDRDFYSAIVQTCLALDEMSSRGVVHGDMHFGNIMFPELQQVVQNVGVKTKMYLVTSNSIGKKSPSTIRVAMDDMDHHINNESELFFSIDRIIKIYDWDWIETEVDGEDKNRYHDKIGFLRNLAALRFPLRAVLDFNTLGDLTRIMKQTEYKRRHVTTNEWVTYMQKSEMNALSEDDVEIMKNVVDRVMEELASYAFLACMYYVNNPYDEEGIFGSGYIPTKPDEVFQKLGSRSSSAHKSA